MSLVIGTVCKSEKNAEVFGKSESLILKIIGI